MAVLTWTGEGLRHRGHDIARHAGRRGEARRARALEWNFVASDRAAADGARDDWTAFPNARFPQLRGETEWIPLPPRPRPEPTAL